MENWKDIKGYEGLYTVSDMGRVYSFITKKVLRPNIGTNGYKYVNLFKNKKGKTTYVHRIVCETFIPRYSTNLEVDHIDEDKTNNNINNLRWVTRFFNASRSTKGILRRAPLFLGGNPRARRVYCYDKNKVLIKVYPCALEVSLETGMHREYIRKRLRKQGFFHNQLSYYYEPIAC